MEKDLLIFNFYAKSNKKPGKYILYDGKIKESVANPSEYDELADIKGWRQMFSNSFVSSFILDDRKWNTVEHYELASQIRDSSKTNMRYYLDVFKSEDELSSTEWDFVRDLSLIEKMLKSNTKKSRERKPLSLTIKSYSIEGINSISKLALFAKFTQDEELKRVLLATNDAELAYIIKDDYSYKTKIWHNLMDVRKCIKKLDSECDLSEVSKFSFEMVNNVIEHNKLKPLETAKNENIMEALHTFPSVLINNIIGEYIGNPFIIVVNVRKEVQIPSISTNEGVSIDWGDDTSEFLERSAPHITHKYKFPGKYTISITGDITDIDLRQCDELVEVSQWGNVKIQTNSPFIWCRNLVSLPNKGSPTFLTNNLSFMFANCKQLGKCDLNEWNVSNITNMRRMFSGCVSFSPDISKWDVSNVTDMREMFDSCSSFNSDLSNWDVKNVTDMWGMFRSCAVFDSSLSKWNVGNVTNMGLMFYNCKHFNTDLSNWDVRNVTNMERIFSNCLSFNSDVSNWNVSNVNHMGGMFENCKVFNCDLSKWDVSNVRSMYYMFYNCSEFNSDLSEWNVGNVTSMGMMFYNCSKFNSDLSNWDVSNVTDMERVFKNCKQFNSDLSNWNVSNVRRSNEMFYNCVKFDSDLSNWDVSVVEDMTKMFFGCKKFNSDLSQWNIGVATVHDQIFDGCTSLEEEHKF